MRGRHLQYGWLSAHTGKRQGEVDAIVFGGIRDLAHSRGVGYPACSTELPRYGKWRLETVAISDDIAVVGVRVALGDIVFTVETGGRFVPRARAAEVLDAAAQAAPRRPSSARSCGHRGGRFAREVINRRSWSGGSDAE